MKRTAAPRLNDTEAVRHCGWPDCQAACCLYGVWVDRQAAENILAHAEKIAAFLSGDRQDPANWFDGRVEEDRFLPSGIAWHTRVLDDPDHYEGTACVFLMPDFRCALQSAGEAQGLHPWHYKPFYCILHPLDLDEKGRITLDNVDLMVNEPASCLRKSDQRKALQDLFRQELDFLS